MVVTGTRQLGFQRIVYDDYHQRALALRQQRATTMGLWDNLELVHIRLLELGTSLLVATDRGSSRAVEMELVSPRSEDDDGF